jgi:hypothetical protein
VSGEIGDELRARIAANDLELDSMERAARHTEQLWSLLAGKT